MENLWRADQSFLRNHFAPKDSNKKDEGELDGGNSNNKFKGSMLLLRRLITADWPFNTKKKVKKTNCHHHHNCRCHRYQNNDRILQHPPMMILPTALSTTLMTAILQ